MYNPADWTATGAYVWDYQAEEGKSRYTTVLELVRESSVKVVIANVMNNAADEAFVDNVRLIFIAGTQASVELANAPDGATLELLALPRIGLNAISAFVQGGGSGTVIRKLPYEMIVVGARTR